MDTVLRQTTVTGRSEFDTVFTEVASPVQSTGAASGGVRLFHVNVRSSKFDYRALCDLLTANIGGYVFSRAQISSFKDHGVERSIDLRAMRALSNSADNDSALGEMLLYTFLEHALGAPKILSKFELDNLSGQQRSKADAIHVLPAGGPGGKTYIVLGAAYIEANLQDSIRTASGRIRQIRNVEEVECQVVDSTVLDREFSAADASTLSSLIIPSKVTQDKEVCYAMFIGYSLGLQSSPDRSHDDFRELVDQKLSADLLNYSAFIHAEISSAGLGSYPFHIYTLPLNDAVADRLSIVDRVFKG